VFATQLGCSGGRSDKGTSPSTQSSLANRQPERVPRSPLRNRARSRRLCFRKEGSTRTIHGWNFELTDATKSNPWQSFGRYLAGTFLANRDYQTAAVRGHICRGGNATPTTGTPCRTGRGGWASIPNSRYVGLPPIRQSLIWPRADGGMHPGPLCAFSELSLSNNSV
jgi:hypothetical protein